MRPLGAKKTRQVSLIFAAQALTLSVPNFLCVSTLTSVLMLSMAAGFQSFVLVSNLESIPSDRQKVRSEGCVRRDVALLLGLARGRVEVLSLSCPNLRSA